MKFYKCDICGNIIVFLKASGAPVVCCGEKMRELIPNSSDGAPEKHIPIITVDSQKATVAVGGIAHPMLREHFIEWIVLETEKGFMKKKLNPGEEPKAEFILPSSDKFIAAYEYCNIHGLWKS